MRELQRVARAAVVAALRPGRVVAPEQPDPERADADRALAVDVDQPTATPPLVHAVAAAQVEADEPAFDELKVSVPVAHLGVRQLQVTAGVEPDQDERLVETARRPQAPPSRRPRAGAGRSPRRRRGTGSSRQTPGGVHDH